MVKKTLKFIAQETNLETKWWSYAAWTLPFVALALVIFDYFLGGNSWINYVVIGITTTFFSVSVFWWWWALNKINVMIQVMSQTGQDFKEIKDEIVAIRQDVKEDVSNRQR